MKYRWLIGLVLGLMLSGCSTIGAEGVYHPTGIPLSISVDTWGEINFEVDTGIKIPTPIGTFEANVIVDPTREFNKQSTLTIRFDDQDHIYDLHGDDFNVSFESGYYEEIHISKKGSNIILELKRVQKSVSEPSNNTVASAPEPVSGGDAYCPAKYPTRLKAGRDASICTQKDRLIIRQWHSMNASEILSIYPGTTIAILDGPVCEDDFWWWKVKIYAGTLYGKQDYGLDPIGNTQSDTTGWAREGWDNKDAYFICP